MRFERKSSFTRQYQKLHKPLQEEVFQAIQSLIQFFETGQRPHSLGLKQLRKPYWEIRIDIRQRILFRLQGDLVEFVLLGNHEEIRRFLKSL